MRARMGNFDPTMPPSLGRRIRFYLRELRRSAFMLLYSLPALVIWLSPYRFINVAVPSRIGHLALEVDWFLKRKALGYYGSIRPILMLRFDQVANKSMLEIWRPNFIHITWKSAQFLLRPLMYFKALRIDTMASVSGFREPALYPSVQDEWGDRAPIFVIPDDMARRGEDTLARMGLPLGAWFVCVHARDGVYSPRDEALHSFRNSSISNCEPAIDEIISRGGWAIRMGEKGSQPLRDRLGVINYPDTAYKSDWMDLFLCSRSRFFLGNTSGICMIPAIMGVPLALINMTPFGACLGLGANDLSIPKAVRGADGELLLFSEIFSSEASTFRYLSQFERGGYVTVENSPAQIRELVLEMLDQVEGGAERTIENENLQRRFRSLLTPLHLSYLSSSKIGSAYLREHEVLLPSEESVLASQARINGLS